MADPNQGRSQGPNHSPSEGQSSAELRLTSRFIRAVDYARVVHVGMRKKTKVPYMAHLLGVVSLVLGENGHVPFAVTEDMAIAALLHDAVEDGGGWSRLYDIEANFGKGVARIVEGCTDSFAEDSSKKEPWEARKKAYIERLRDDPDSTLLVSLADKVFNVRAILADHRTEGARVWERFDRGPADHYWYYSELLKVFLQKCQGWRIVDEFEIAVAELSKLCDENAE